MSNNLHEHEEWVVNDQAIKEFKMAQEKKEEETRAHSNSYDGETKKKHYKGKFSAIAGVITILLIVGLFFAIFTAVSETPNYSDYYPQDQVIVINRYSVGFETIQKYPNGTVDADYRVTIDIACLQEDLKDFMFIFYFKVKGSDVPAIKNSTLQSISGNGVHFTLNGNFSVDYEIEEIIKIDVQLADGTKFTPQVKERPERNDSVAISWILRIVPAIMFVNVLGIILDHIALSKKEQAIKNASTSSVPQNRSYTHKSQQSKMQVCPYCDQLNPKDANKCISCGANLRK